MAVQKKNMQARNDKLYHETALNKSMRELDWHSHVRTLRLCMPLAPQAGWHCMGHGKLPQ
jgi:hypothetical protein